MFLRYAYLYKRSLPRAFEIVFWPVMELLVWGFVSIYILTVSRGLLADVASSLIAALIFWDVLYRVQQGVSISIVEDVWTQNIVNILISPLRVWEWVAATFLYGAAKTLISTALLVVIAWGLYRFGLIDRVHFYLIPLAANFLLFGWALGLFTSSLIVRWGHAAEALIWGIPFLIQPLSAVFYPIEVLPPWLQPAARALPSSYLFEGMRSVIATGRMPSSYLVTALALNLVYFAAAGTFFAWMFRSARRTGRLGRLGMD
jgi:ABC-2 type transport system permease protein